jgi:hypothetical protein
MKDTGSRRVVAWVSTDEAERHGTKDIGGWGGLISKGDRWIDYIANMKPEFVEYHAALREAILGRGLRRGGDWHQNAPDGVPMFDDGAVATFSFRAWGDLLAAVWAQHDERDYWYMDFYMDSCVTDAGMELSQPLKPGG